MKVGSIFTSQKESQQAWFGKKEEETPRKSKNEQSAEYVMLMAFWDCRDLVYTEFGPDVLKEKQNVTQGTYKVFQYFNAFEECDMVQEMRIAQSKSHLDL